MLKKIVLLFAILFSSVFAKAINDIGPIGARASGMGNSGVAMSGFWSIGRNQAGLAFLQKKVAGVCYENRFLIKEMSYKTGAFAFPTSSGVFGVIASQFGSQLYNENKFGIAYANKFGEKIAVGLQLDYLHTYIAENYGSKSVLTFEAGFIGQLTENLFWGTHIFNPIQAKISNYNNEKIPTNFRIGASYLLGNTAIINIDAETNSQENIALKTGCEYHITKPLYIRLGVSTNPMLNTFGFGLEYNKLKFDFVSYYHSVLGISPQFSLSYDF